MTQSHEHSVKSNASARVVKLALIGFLLIGAFYLLTEHQAHLFGVLPWLLLLACPLLHLFMHGWHGHSRDDGSAGDGPPSGHRP